MRNLYVLAGLMLAWSLLALWQNEGWPFAFWLLAGTWVYIEAYRLEKRQP